MADDFIPREAAYESLLNGMVMTGYQSRALDCISEFYIPSADVAPVRHGRWIKTIGENGVTSACRCNLCGFEDNRFSLFNYCHNCGAAMDKGG